MARRRGYPGNGVEVRRVIFGADPIATEQADAQFVMRGLDLSGHSGWVKRPMAAGPSSWGTRFAGDAGPLQNFRGSLVGRTDAGIRPGFNRALPSTAGPVVTNNRVLDVLRAAHL